MEMKYILYKTNIYDLFRSQSILLRLFHSNFVKEMDLFYVIFELI